MGMSHTITWFENGHVNGNSYDPYVNSLNCFQSRGRCDDFTVNKQCSWGTKDLAKLEKPKPNSSADNLRGTKDLAKLEKPKRCYDYYENRLNIYWRIKFA